MFRLRRSRTADANYGDLTVTTPRRGPAAWATSLAVHHRRAVLITALIGMLVAGVVGGPVAGLLSDGGFDDPSSPSSQASSYLRDHLHSGPPDVTLVVSGADGRSVDDPAVAAAGQRYTARLAGDARLTDVASYWSLGRPAPLRSRDGHDALVVARLGGDPNSSAQRIGPLLPQLRAADGPITVHVGGFAPTFHDINTKIRDDLAHAEAIAIPITAVLLILVFGSAVAAALPLVIGVLSILGTLLLLRGLVAVTPVSVFALNLTTSASLGLGIDYGLFLVTRYREELRAGAPPEVALHTTLRTAGRTVAYSALTVAVSLSALLVFPQYFLRSFAYAGIGVVAFAALSALVVLPALLLLVGPRIDAFDLRRPLRRLLRLGPPRPPSLTDGFWPRIARGVMRRPLPIATAVVALLLVLGVPFLSAKFGLSDDRVLPASADSRVAGDLLRTAFPADEADSLQVVAPGGHTLAQLAAVGPYAARLSTLPHVSRVESSAGVYVAGRQALPPSSALARYDEHPGAGQYLSIVPTVTGYSPQGAQLVKDVRAVPAPFPTLVGGDGAQFLDARASIASRLPLAVGLIAVVTLAVLFLLTGSVLLPIKAVVLNLLSMSASFGAMVWVFQDGHGAGILGFTPNGLLDLTTPLLMFALVFGLSMDYEVFILSRIKEEYERTGDTPTAVANGLARTGRLVSSAAVLLAVVFLAIASSHVTFIKLMGVGVALAVLVDATLVRATLVPASMRLLGRANWWAPKPLRRLHRRFGWAETEQPPAEPTAAPPERVKVAV